MGKSMVSCRFSLKPIHWMLDELNLFFERIQKVDHIDSSVTFESGLVVLSSTVVESELFDFKAYGMRPESLQRRGRRRPPLAKQWSTALLMIRNLLNSTAVMQKKKRVLRCAANENYIVGLWDPVETQLSSAQNHRHSTILVGCEHPQHIGNNLTMWNDHNQLHIMVTPKTISIVCHSIVETIPH